MSPIETTLTVAPDGTASIDARTGLPAGRHRVLLFLADDEEARDPNGWPIDFFAQTYGSCADDPLPEVTSEPPQEREALV
jgi:hypothetical protein